MCLFHQIKVIWKAVGLTPGDRSIIMNIGGKDKTPNPYRTLKHEKNREYFENRITGDDVSTHCNAESPKQTLHSSRVPQRKLRQANPLVY